MRAERKGLLIVLVGVVGLLWLGSTVGGEPGQEESADETFLQQVDQIRFLEAPSYTFLLAAISEHRPEGKGEPERSEALLQGFVKRFPEGERIRLEFREPEGMRGTIYLIVGRDFYLWQPGLPYPLRISGQQRLFGAASIAEAAGLRFYHRYRVEARERDALGQRSALRVELTALDPSEAYPQVTLWVEEGSYVPLEAQLRSLSGEALKQVAYISYASLGEDRYVSELSVQDLIF